MIGIQTISKTLPKTGTEIITVLKDGVKTAKIVAPGPGNKSADLINCMTTQYRNGKPESIVLNLQHSNVDPKLDVLNYNVRFAKVHQHEKDLFQRMQ